MGKLTFVVTRIYVYETLCPNRCEPSIEVIIKNGGPMGGARVLGGTPFFKDVRVDVNVIEGLNLL